MQDKIREIISEKTEQSYEQVARDLDRDYYLTPPQAVEYGLVDEIITSKK